MIGWFNADDGYYYYYYYSVTNIIISIIIILKTDDEYYYYYHCTIIIIFPLLLLLLLHHDGPPTFQSIDDLVAILLYGLERWDMCMLPQNINRFLVALHRLTVFLALHKPLQTYGQIE